jgi:hypothetical protein
MDLNNMQWWVYGAIVGGVVLVVGFVLYFLPTRKLKVPGVAVSGVGGMALGLALGIIWLAGFGYKPGGPPPVSTDENQAKLNAAPGGIPGGGAPKAKGGGMPKGGGGGGPSSKTQLVRLVNALDTLVDRPVTLTLSADDKAKIAEQLKGLDAAAEVKDDDAKARLEAILTILEKDRKALESVGYNWPGGQGGGGPKGGFGPPKDLPNPFADGAPKDKLKSLQERLEKKA